MTETNPSAKADLALYEAGRKSLSLAYILWFLFGLFGAHRFYAGAGKTGWWLLALFLVVLRLATRTSGGWAAKRSLCPRAPSRLAR